MWPSNISNPKYLTSIYGNLPNFNPLEIVEIRIDERGPAAYVRFGTTLLPKIRPKRWGEFNSIIIEVSLFAIEKISISKFLSSGSSRMSFIQGEKYFTCILSGSVEASIMAEWLDVVKITGILDERYI